MGNNHVDHASCSGAARRAACAFAGLFARAQQGLITATRPKLASSVSAHRNVSASLSGHDTVDEYICTRWQRIKREEQVLWFVSERYYIMSRQETSSPCGRCSSLPSLYSRGRGRHGLISRPTLSGVVPPLPHLRAYAVSRSVSRSQCTCQLLVSLCVNRRCLHRERSQL